jgi:hypothetical protein
VDYINITEIQAKIKDHEKILIGVENTYRPKCKRTITKLEAH